MSEVPLRCIPSTQTISGVDINPVRVTSRGFLATPDLAYHRLRPLG